MILKWGVCLALLSLFLGGFLFAPVAPDVLNLGLFLGGFLIATVALVLLIISIRKIAGSPNAYKGMATAILFIPVALFSGTMSVIRIGNAVNNVVVKIGHWRGMDTSFESARRIRTACLEFAESHEGKFPNDLRELVDGKNFRYMEDLQSPFTYDPANPLWYELLLPGAIAADYVDTKTPLIRDPFTLPDGRQPTVYNDGSDNLLNPSSAE